MSFRQMSPDLGGQSTATVDRGLGRGRRPTRRGRAGWARRVDQGPEAFEPGDEFIGVTASIGMTLSDELPVFAQQFTPLVVAGPSRH